MTVNTFEVDLVSQIMRHHLRAMPAMLLTTLKQNQKQLNFCLFWLSRNRAGIHDTTLLSRSERFNKQSALQKTPAVTYRQTLFPIDDHIKQTVAEPGREL